jgi:hypothetical protein
MARARISLAILSLLSLPISMPMPVPIPRRTVENFNFAEITMARRTGKKIRFAIVRRLPNYRYLLQTSTPTRRRIIRPPRSVVWFN